MSPTSYRPSQKALHWTIAILVFGLYGITYVEEFFPRGDPGRAWVWWLHVSFGLTLLALVLIRIPLRLAVGAPALPADSSRLERLAAHGAHLALYALLLVIPLLGIVTAWYRDMAVSFFGLFVIPSPVAPDRTTAHDIQELHNLAATAILVVAAIHAAAALWHHFVRRDDVLLRMLPAHGHARTGMGQGARTAGQTMPVRK